MTLRSLVITSMYVISSYFVAAVGAGSALYTPSTPECVPFSSASASISAARSAARCRW
jgi:hypothetical protein